MSVHLGYYIIGKERQVELPNHGVECERDASHNFTKGSNYCGQCGGMIVASTAVLMNAADIYDIPEDEGCIEDHFLFPEYTPAKKGEVIGISNYRACGHFAVIDEDVIINLEDIEEAKSRQYKDFMQRHENDIELLMKYVYDDVQVKYGLFEYDY